MTSLLTYLHFPQPPVASPINSFMEVTMLGPCSPQSDMGFDQGRETAAGQLVWESVGFPGGFRDDGGSHASAAGGNVRVVSLGVRGGGCDEGDGEGR